MALFLLTICPALFADKSPVARPDKQQIGLWFSLLKDKEPFVRDKARQDLLGLTTTEFPILKELAQQRTLDEGQKDVLREVVVYAKVRSAMEWKNTESGFLGVNLMPIYSQFGMINNNGINAAIDNVDPPAPPGAFIAGRVMGFVAYRYMCDGDIVLAMGSDRADTNLRSSDELRAVVSSMRPGQNVHHEILRGGRVVEVCFPLDARPAPKTDALLSDSAPPQPQIVEIQQMDTTIEILKVQATEFWEKEFAPLLEDKHS